jgi:hypothetical protein
MTAHYDTLHVFVLLLAVWQVRAFFARDSSGDVPMRKAIIAILARVIIAGTASLLIAYALGFPK